MKLPKSIYITIISLVLFQILFVNCNKKDETPTGPEINPPTESNTGILVGTISDIDGNELADVIISAAGKTVSTNNQGYFTLEELNPTEKLLVTFEKEGYVTSQKIVAITVGTAAYINGALSIKAPPETFHSSLGGTITSQGITFTLPGNSYVDQSGNPYGGTVNLTSTYFDPALTSYVDLFPGDFTGVTTSGGTPQPIESYGFFDAELSTPDGSLLNLTSGSQVNITFPISPSLVSTAPETISLFYYNLPTGEWIEDGTATKQGGNYVGSVTHFTSWNYDRYYDITYIEGRVVDADGNPITNARVEANGIDYTGLSYKYTNSDGTFRLGVRPNSHIDVAAKKGGVTSAVIIINPTGGNQETENIGDILLAPPTGTITLTWSELPQDLDAHLLVPAQSAVGDPGHVFHRDKGSGSLYPYAELDTDDQDGNGPEIISIYKNLPGTYTYFVHNYDAQYFCSDPNQECDQSGYLSASNARVNLIFGGKAYTFNVPNSNPELKAVWRLFEINIDDLGNISINQLNDFADYGDLFPNKASLPTKQ